MEDLNFTNNQPVTDWSRFQSQITAKLYSATTPDKDLPKDGDWILNPDFAPKQSDPSLKDAAVLIPVLKTANGPKLLLTRRTKNLSSHAGQIAFPGGRIDKSDKSPIDAALREAHEEVGLNRENCEILGILPQYLTRTRYRIIPVLGLIQSDQTFTANPAEVDEIFDVPLSFLMDPTNHKKVEVTYENKQRFYYEMPYGRHYIWGVTAGIIKSLYNHIAVG